MNRILLKNQVSPYTAACRILDSHRKMIRLTEPTTISHLMYPANETIMDRVLSKAESDDSDYEPCYLSNTSGTAFFEKRSNSAGMQLNQGIDLSNACMVEPSMANMKSRDSIGRVGSIAISGLFEHCDAAADAGDDDLCHNSSRQGDSSWLQQFCTSPTQTMLFPPAEPVVIKTPSIKRKMHHRRSHFKIIGNEFMYH